MSDTPLDLPRSHANTGRVKDYCRVTSHHGLLGWGVHFSYSPCRSGPQEIEIDWVLLRSVGTVAWEFEVGDGNRIFELLEATYADEVRTDPATIEDVARWLERY